MKNLTLGTALLTCLILSGGAGAAPPVDEIVNKANLASYYSGDDGVARATMVITDGSGRTREREFTILRKDLEDGGRQDYYVYFHKPGDVRKTVFLVQKKVDGDDDRWMYLPALDLVKRIAASDKRTSFVGSHFLYEDVSGRGVAEDTHTLQEETDQQYVLLNTPKNTTGVEFASYRLWIDKATFLPVKAEYTDPQGKVYRRVEALKVETVGGHPTVTESRVEDLNTGGNTVMTFSKVEYDQGIDED
ncbi:MAG: outer membrane lipoprotein-sorting protein, partial [Deferrisomatales bacterium]|nr:outer membrane lipoprotein-sorting protein [Deferrisomatales bacterium]